MVLFVPSVERDGVTTIKQQHWVDAALTMFGRVFGGATAYPRATGVWRDDENKGALVKEYFAIRDFRESAQRRSLR